MNLVARAKRAKTLRIICGTDFSENARQAARATAAIAKRLNDPVLLVHAVDKPSIKPASRAELFKWLTNSRRRWLLEEGKRLHDTGADVSEQIISGSPDEVLVKLSQERPTRLIVVSSLGRRGAERWFLGSVAERTAERATVPTLVVRDAAPFESWACGARPLKVFVAFNFTATSEAALLWAKELQAINLCDLVVGYVDWPPERRVRLGGNEPSPLAGNAPELRAILERDLKARAAELLGDIPFRVRVEENWGRPDIRLAEMAREEGADIVVVGSHQYQGFERLWHTSVSRGVLHEAAMSVAVVPLAAGKKRRAGMAPPVRRVLVTTDFSELANTAVAHSYSLLRGGGTVHLLHVVGQNAALSGSKREQRSSAGQARVPRVRHVRECVARLRALIPPEAAAHGITTQAEVIQSRDVAEAICQSAERLGVDVICLGTHGRSGLSKALMGSVAQKVMARSRRPLLVVRQPVI